MSGKLKVGGAHDPHPFESFEPRYRTKARRETFQAMSSDTKANWLIPLGLVLLSVVPAVAGISRIAQLGSGAAITPDNARFFAAPLPVILHIVSSVVYCVLGAFQFPSSVRRRNPRRHRAMGKILIPCGLTAAFTGLWMTLVYPSPDLDGLYLYAIRLVVGLAMSSFLWFGLVAIHKREFAIHGAWMTRAYALGLGAGTQVLTHLPWFLFPDIRGEFARTVFMGAGWVINLAVAEWIILRKRNALLCV
jgi:uncharacterized membrane protein